jgi:hypothetical protein
MCVTSLTSLKVSVDAIANFDEEATINVVANTIHNHNQAVVISYCPTFNPIHKVVEILERTMKAKK